jgi:vacuolar-type H+-ATPase subunit E/Vma4
MSEKELLKALEQDARREYAAIIEEAEKEADTILKAAAEEANGLRQKEFEKAKKSIEFQKVGMLANARLYAKELILKERQLAINKVLDMAYNRLQEMRHDKDYPDILKRLFKEAADKWLTYMQDEKAAVVASKKDIAILADLNNASGFEFIPYQTENMPPGVVIMSKDKRYRVINTLHSRLERAKIELTSMIDRILFGEDSC